MDESTSEHVNEPLAKLSTIIQVYAMTQTKQTIDEEWSSNHDNDER